WPAKRFAALRWRHTENASRARPQRAACDCAYSCSIREAQPSRRQEATARGGWRVRLGVSLAISGETKAIAGGCQRLDGLWHPRVEHKPGGRKLVSKTQATG